MGAGIRTLVQLCRSRLRAGCRCAGKRCAGVGSVFVLPLHEQPLMPTIVASLIVGGHQVALLAEVGLPCRHLRKELCRTGYEGKPGRPLSGSCNRLRDKAIGCL